jgi:hypothetical protein
VGHGAEAAAATTEIWFQEPNGGANENNNNNNTNPKTKRAIQAIIQQQQQQQTASTHKQTKPNQTKPNQTKNKNRYVVLNGVLLVSLVSLILSPNKFFLFPSWRSPTAASKFFCVFSSLGYVSELKIC